MSERTKLSRNRIIYDFSDVKTLMIEKWQVVLLVSLFCAGLFLGSFYINNADGEIVRQIKDIIQSSFSARSSETSLEIFKDALLKYGVFLFMSFFFGLCGLGYPLVAGIPVLCGIANGIMSGYLYQCFGLQGLLYCLLTIYPPLIISLASLIMGSCESMELSKGILTMLIDKHHITVENLMKKYVYQYSILLVIVSLASILEVVLCHLFLGKFTLFP